MRGVMGSDAWSDGGEKIDGWWIKLMEVQTDEGSHISHP